MKIILVHENCYLVGDSPLEKAIKIWRDVYLVEFFPDGGEMIRFLKHIVHKHIQVNLQNLLNH